MKKKPATAGISNKDPDESDVSAQGTEGFLMAEIARLTAQLEAETAAHQRTGVHRYLLSSIVESSEDSIVSIDFDAIITSWNRAAEVVYGYSAAEVLGKSLMMLTLPEDLQEILARIETVKHHQRSELFVTARVRKDGSRIWLSVQMSPIKAANGELIGISTIGRDVTEQKGLQEALRVRALEIQHALDYAEATLRTAPVPLLVLEADLRVHTANDAFYANFQVTPDESEGRLIYDLGNGQWDIPHLRKLLEEILPKNNPFKNFEVSHEFESIGPRSMVLSAQRMENETGQPPRIVLAIEDITERKRDEDSRATLAAVVESSDDAIISKDLDGIITSWNGGAERLFGYTAREAIGQPVMMLIPADLENEEPGILERIRHGEILGHHETVRCRKDHTRVNVSLTVSPIYDAHGRIVGASKVARDISKRRRVEEALRASEERFRTAVSAVSDIIWTNNAEGEMEGEQQGWGAFSGQRREEYQGYGWSNAVHPEDAQQTLDAWNLAVAEKRLFKSEHRMRRYDGEWRLCSVRAVPVLDPKGEIREWVGVHTDITERRRAEVELANREAHLRRVINNQLGLVGVIDRDGILLEVDERSLAIAKARREQVIGKHFADAPWWSYDPEVAGRMRDAMRRALAGEVVRYDVSLFAHGDEGVMIDFMIAPVFGDDGGVEFLIPSGVDIRERYAAEQQLKVSEEFNRTVLESSPDCVKVLDDEGRLQFINTNGMCAMEIDDFGPFRNQPWWDLWGAENLKMVKQAVATALESGTAHFQALCPTAKGTMKWWDVVVGQVAGSNPKRLVSISRDLTERKRAEEELRASEERFRAVVGAVSDMIWTHNPGGEMKGEQSVWGKFTGQQQEDYDSYGWTNAVHPDDVQPTLDAWKHAVANNRMYEFQHRVRRHDGEWRLCSVLAVPVPDPKGGIREWVGVHTDITERDRAAKLNAEVNEALLLSSLRLSESEERIRLATEATEVGIWEWDVRTGAVRWDAQMSRLYGIDPTADGFVQYTDWSTAVLPEDLSENERILQNTVRACGRSHREFRIRRRDDGEIRDIESVETVRSNGHGQADWVLGTNLDVTERRRAQTALIAAKEHAEAASRAKDDFLAALSHELRTPLTPVLMAATALSGDPSLPAEARGQLDMMRRNIELEARIIDDLLDLTRISSGKLWIAPVTADLHELLHHADEITRSDGMGKRLRVVLKLDAARHHASADPTRIQQVFWNLMRNAVKFTPKGGTITVSTRNDAEGRIIISVADNGIGIRAEALAKIFNAFEQGDTAGEHRYGGLGLGLAISNAIVTAHGGEIRGESAGSGQGAVFTVTLGTVPAPAAASGKETPQAPPTRSLSVLIVEDHEASRMVLAHFLTLSGHRITTAATAHEALAAYQAATFDAVISDLGLPDGSGIDLMVEIQNIRPVPAIALSGYGMERDLQRTKDAGFSAHLVKPVKVDQLKKLLAGMASQDGA